MSLPIPIIAGNFEKFHKTQAKKNNKRKIQYLFSRKISSNDIFENGFVKLQYMLKITNILYVSLGYKCKIGVAC